MKKVLKFSFVVVFVFNAGMVFGQQELDSLIRVLESTKEDTNKVNLLDKIGKIYTFSGDYAKANSYIGNALSLARRLQFKRGISYAENMTGTINKFQNNYPVALQYYFSALAIRKELHDAKGCAAIDANIGIVYEDMGNYPEAIKYYLLSRKIDEQVGDEAGIASALQGLGGISKKQGDLKNALSYQQQALQIELKLGKKSMLGYSYNSIGIIYGEMAQKTKSTDSTRWLMNEALKNQLNGLKIRQELGEKNGIVMSFGNVGAVYMIMGDTQKARENEIASLKVSLEIGNKEGIANAYLNLGDIEKQMKNFQGAKKYYNAALEINTKIGNVEGAKEAYECLAETDSSLGDFSSAFRNYKLYVIYRDSLVNEENTKKTVQAQMEYDFDKREANTKAEQDKKDAVAATEKKRQKIILGLVSGFLFLVILFAAFVLRSFLQKRKANEEITKQKLIVEVKQKEILDSIHYAKRIQQALLTSEKYFDKNIARLKN